MHTPRLCIDARAGQEMAAMGAIAQEAVDQLVAGWGEDETSSEWIEKRRVVVLSHPDQVFSGQLKRHDTALGLARSPWHWIQHRHFCRDSGISIFHGFHPIDRCTPSWGLPTLTTLLPPVKRLPFFLSRKSEHHYLVPSEKDALLLKKRYLIPDSQVTTLLPATRRYVHFTDRPTRKEEGSLLLVTGGPVPQKLQQRLFKGISEKYPKLPKRALSLRQVNQLSAMDWRKKLEDTRLLIYLVSSPFDWATLPLEAIYWGIPTVFLDEHAALNELLPQSRFRLSRFLVDPPSLKELDIVAERDRTTLEERDCFDELAFAKSYRDAYRKLSV